ncbi:hypothetical protein O181_030843 [Austropuccinia psidii MF-1]|uniref:Galactokinase n=1 Tax=Austropuccinia psidii MF-1 TaxID=1389203 RepID=A0A9Q3CYF9_9BASI|nr:hypothetical protein [Austropuccinia psidii MF-1]
MADIHPPVLAAKSLEEIYTQPSLPAQTTRWASLTELFKKNYSHLPQFVARAPGRVNIIGEHIDYCGFSVLPAAIEPDILIAASASYSSNPSTDQLVQVKALNLNPIYPELCFSYKPSSKLELANGGWPDYLKSAFNIALDHLQASSSLMRIPTSIKFLVHGTLPAGSGLSSSAAFITASLLAILHIHQPLGSQLSKSLVASLATVAEQACGVSVGGMDQTASVFGWPGQVLHIEFTPTTQVVPLDLPNQPRTTFVIANSLVTSNKLESAKEQYNLRVVECRIATRLLSSLLLSEIKKAPNTLRELLDLYKPAQPIMETIQDVLDKMAKSEKLGSEAGLTLPLMLEKLQMTQEQFESDIIRGLEVKPKGGVFKPLNRARHVFREARRVYQFKELLEKTKQNQHAEETIHRMGELMRKSQTSCQLDYECSCEALDQLVTIASAHKSIGSRLTGAGWGGASVHLVRDEHVADLIKALHSKYYAIRFPQLSYQELSDACFATKPEGGACIFTTPETFVNS